MEVCIIIKYKNVKQNSSTHVFRNIYRITSLLHQPVLLSFFDIAIYHLLVNYMFTIIFICEKWGTKINNE